jgi:hypothetical protein
MHCKATRSVLVRIARLSDLILQFRDLFPDFIGIGQSPTTAENTTSSALFVKLILFAIVL